MNDTLQALMREATQLTRAGRLTEATRAIQRALQGSAGERDAGVAGGDARAGSPEVLDGCVFEVQEGADAGVAGLAPPPPAGGSAPGPGEFKSGVHAAASLSMDYKLYVPPAATAGRSLPLVVMLHGCTQNPDDFAAGTAMNELARERGFFVLYPAQSKAANPHGCWNWFKHTHQQRGRGEPAAIATLTQQIVAAHGIDARRVFIAGLSAGGAMAAVVARAYPELFAAVGVHSGLPAGAASDVAQALAAMKSGVAEGIAGGSPLRARRPGAARPAAPVPTIVFHGDQDGTVHHRNGEQVIAAALAAHPAPGLDARVEHGVTPGGRRYTRAVHRAGRGEVVAEHWVVHGAGHAWSGGRAAGSYTDASGPDATREMLRFFLEHPHAHHAAPHHG